MYDNNKHNFLIFASSTNDKQNPENEQVEILEVEINFFKANQIRNDFYKDKLPKRNFVETGTMFHEDFLPFLSKEGLANVVVNKKPNGKTILPLDSCGCCFTEHNSFDFTINQYEPNMFVESLFFPYLCQKLVVHKANNQPFLEVENYCKESARYVPQFLGYIFEHNINNVGKNCSTNEPAQIFANTIWMRSVLKKLESQDEIEARKQFLDCVTIRQKDKTSFDEITSNFVKRYQTWFMTDEAHKMQARSYTTTGRILNYFAKYDKDSPENIDQHEIKATKQMLLKNTAEKETLRFLGVKIQRPEIREQKPQFRPIS